MRIRTTASIALLALAGLGTATHAQKSDPATFLAPVRLKSGDAFLGQGRLYPSPTVFDVDADGVPDVVIGDLIGKMTVALGSRGEEGLTLGASMPMKAQDGNELRFHNW
ncbi:MAG: hypothetical protein R3F20_01505 [Planctomycetota bacterium]